MGVLSSQLPCPTSPVDHVTPQPGESLLQAFECWQEAADKKACCDYSLHVDIPQWNESVKDELELLVHEKGSSLFRGSCVCVWESCSPLQFPFQTHFHPQCWNCFTRTMGTDLETIWPKDESSYIELNSRRKSVVLITMLSWWHCRHSACNLF